MFFICLYAHLSLLLHIIHYQAQQWQKTKQYSYAQTADRSHQNGLANVLHADSGTLFPKHAVHGIESIRSKPQYLKEIVSSDEQRIDLMDDELNRVLGGGLVQGSLTLLGGEPGIGKSTLVLQTVLHLTNKRILYISGEESARQLKLRADRIKHNGDSELLIACETSLEQIFANIKSTAPDLVIIDSIQTISTETLDSSPGSIVQVRECSAAILRFAKETGTPVILIGHINKEGSIAGPKVLEHIVDTVLQFEGDQHYMYRILRSIKNRFGSTAELGIYEMRQDGLRQVSNPSELLPGS